MFARQGLETTILARTESEVKLLMTDSRNKRLAPDAWFPPSLKVTSSAEEALNNASVVIFAVPSAVMRENASKIAGFISSETHTISASKGLEAHTGRRMTQVIKDELPHLPMVNIGALSGPNLAVELAKKSPASATLAFPDQSIAESVQADLNSTDFRIYSSDDVTGVELGGTLKNIIAIGAGIIDGLALGENAKAAFITRGLHEMGRFASTLGAKADTLYGLSGMGDVIATCHSPLSRNYRAGLGLAQEGDLDKILVDINRTVEGINTCIEVAKLGHKVGINMPITFLTHEVIEGRISPQEAITSLMRREPRFEMLI